MFNGLSDQSGSGSGHQLSHYSVRMQLETIRVNVLGMLNLADICFEKKIHLTTYATGCIFHYDKDFPEGSGKGFKEADKPNFTGSYYSYTKACLSLTCQAPSSKAC